MDKCDSHDDCFNRLYAKMDAMDDKLDRVYGELHSRLHEGDLRFVQLEMRLAQCEKALATSQSGKIDMRKKAVSTAFDLLKLAAVAIFGAACWAFANGYKG